MSEALELERQNRKSRSGALLRAEGIPVNDWLPAIESESESTLRTPEEIAPRTVCLLIVAARASGLPGEIVEGLIARHGVSGYFTDTERAFLATMVPNIETRSQMSWRIESAWVLLWALGFVQVLGLPTDQIQPDSAVAIVEEQGLEGLVANASPRSSGDVLDEADLIYRCHWATREDEVRGSHKADEILEPGVTRERHWALNWLITCDDQEWDDVTTDT